MLKFRNAGIALMALVVLAMLAPDVSAQATSATGTWKWTQQFGGGRGRGNRGATSREGGAAPRDGAPRDGAPAARDGAAADGAGRRAGRGAFGPTELSAKLTQDGEKLTGSITGANFQDPTAATEIKEGSVKAGTVTFKVVTEGRGGQITRTYTGKIEGDKISGTMAFDFGANGPPGGNAPQPIEWVANREAAK